MKMEYALYDCNMLQNIEQKDWEGMVDNTLKPSTECVTAVK